MIYAAFYLKMDSGLAFLPSSSAPNKRLKFNAMSEASLMYETEISLVIQISRNVRCIQGKVPLDG